ncbi:MAG: hypothetical protein A3H57_03020 [Candidatus Taylorbacteria bacterium RIFCSPLOWO2_02_FULL_43_11]|uniref:Uncharacterized protein n=1 Tax=Candidatus Taylorbacteria bacterium RIFCSPHIGHO2_02_FULL_43_32b TaxID=1802306 RepID=A0A1G2MIW2_9BACT|nr:MAG: hypothetical protein A2743_03115 [Candidatus Taylorbacteria bacterium RIFCSPHIGHO2_01_FULL_43_47]OHA23813.1 MAG: hypothetical protein A3C72_00845 [Candidatus Taylorbacteria bacterium RIFCSPHIGHO2_02_FULL_43_32b]OHA30675.1 MAG: hypothetical protein A3B08_02645 [Candidatus Taylorbacteria bacterium RIFCSPLOWO2_01_FULL_43_44]OHA37426.1 MAG: hypothetical protein A3H57_03020 [Candidatus Taylorbacteria bacterium RIFCSPLOWO2_02_FULL_43_11]
MADKNYSDEERFIERNITLVRVVADQLDECWRPAIEAWRDCRMLCPEEKFIELVVRPIESWGGAKPLLPSEFLDQFVLGAPKSFMPMKDAQQFGHQLTTEFECLDTKAVKDQLVRLYIAYLQRFTQQVLSSADRKALLSLIKLYLNELSETEKKVFVSHMGFEDLIECSGSAIDLPSDTATREVLVTAIGKILVQSDDSKHVVTNFLSYYNAESLRGLLKANAEIMTNSTIASFAKHCAEKFGVSAEKLVEEFLDKPMTVWEGVYLMQLQKYLEIADPQSLTEVTEQLHQ